MKTTVKELKEFLKDISDNTCVTVREGRNIMFFDLLKRVSYDEKRDLVIIKGQK